MASSPMMPHRAPEPPRDTMLRRTLALPPSSRSSRVTLTTGTGASGEMRDTVPQTK